MPTSYVRKLGKKHKTGTRRSEEKWNEAKKAASNEGKGDNYAYIMSIYKSMMHESSIIARVATRLAVTSFGLAVKPSGYDEKKSIDGGTIYRKGSTIQIKWNGGRCDTWNEPTVNEAIKNFRDMVDRGND